MTPRTPAIPAAAGHLAVRYRCDGDLADAVAGAVLSPPHDPADVVLLIATADHLAGFAAALAQRGVDVAARRASGHHQEMDAEQVLAELWDGEEVDARQLVPVLAAHDATARAGGGRLRVYGELVTLLWDRGEAGAAMQLEDRWNHLIGVYGFNLVCGYPARLFPGGARDPGLAAVGARHRGFVDDWRAVDPEVVVTLDLAALEAEPLDTTWSPGPDDSVMAPRLAAGAGGRPGAVRDLAERLAARAQALADVERSRCEHRIGTALEEERFVLHAQAIVELTTGRTVQHELLLRLWDPAEGLLAPQAFLPAAEAYGLIPVIDRWVLGRAVRLAAQGHPIELNLSARSISDPRLPDEVEQLLADHAADPGLLVIELTETAMLANHAAAARFATRIRALGCRFALDDFGTGYGALTSLKHLPVDVLKIDREFVADVTTDRASRHVVATLVALARGLGITTVAEGVEDRTTLELLTALGVDQAQGHHLGRPGALDTVLGVTIDAGSGPVTPAAAGPTGR